MYDSIFSVRCASSLTTSCSFLTPHPATANSMRQIQKQKNGFFRHIEPSLSSISREMCRLARDITRQIPGGPRVESRPANQYTPYCADGFRSTRRLFHAGKRPCAAASSGETFCARREPIIPVNTSPEPALASAGLPVGFRNHRAVRMGNQCKPSF